MVNEKIRPGELSSTTIATNVTAYKRNGIGMFVIWGVSITGGASGTTVCTIPEGFRPCDNVGFTTASTTIRGTIYPNGTVAVWNTGSTTNSYATVTYILA